MKAKRWSVVAALIALGITAFALTQEEQDDISYARSESITIQNLASDIAAHPELEPALLPDALAIKSKAEQAAAIASALLAGE